jgi:hypothetical protein
MKLLFAMGVGVGWSLEERRKRSSEAQQCPNYWNMRNKDEESLKILVLQVYTLP